MEGAFGGEPQSVSRPIGLYILIACALYMAAVPLLLPLPNEVPLGRFTLEGRAAQAAYVVWSAAWLLMAGCLLTRKPLGYWIAMAVLGLHIVLLISNVLRWLADNDASLPIAMEIAVWPVLSWAFADLLAIAYLHAHRRSFAWPRVRPNDAA